MVCYFRTLKPEGVKCINANYMQICSGDLPISKN